MRTPNPQQQRLTELIAPILQDLALELVGIEYQNAEKAHLRIYIDKPEGVTLDDCQAASLQISAILDVEDPISGRYQLEVSSPGLARPLFKMADFVRFANQRIKLKLAIAFEGQRNFAGILRGVEDDMVVLQVEDEELLLPFEHIERANIVPEFATGKKNKHGKKNQPKF